MIEVPVALVILFPMLLAGAYLLGTFHEWNKWLDRHRALIDSLKTRREAHGGPTTIDDWWDAWHDTIRSTR